MSKIIEFLDRKLDSDQLSAVNTDRNSVVSAGAGSGKTTVLSYRFLRLIVEGKASVDEILTLTFTRKAAAEMHERIHRLLAVNSKNTLIMKQLRQFEKANISTLDSFCARIARTDCIRYGIPADFVQDDEKSMKIARETAMEMLLNLGGMHGDKGLLELIRLHTVDGVVEKILLPLAANFCSPARPIDFPACAEKQITLLQIHAKDTLLILTESAKLILTLPQSSAVLKQAAGIAQSLLNTVIEHVEDGCWEQAGANLNKLRIWRKPSGKKEELLLLLEQTIIWQKEFPLLILLVKSLARRTVMNDVYQFLSSFQEEFLKRKRSSGTLSFLDVSTLAVDILLTSKPVRAYYKKQFRFIMIDEFQDNNELQRKLLFLLAEKHDRHSEGVPEGNDLIDDKLFFVGDEKQSIYRFRGADVSVFKHLKKDITEIGGQQLMLKTNYRSIGSLINRFNTFFSSIMDGTEDYEAEFLPLLAGMQYEGSSIPLDIMVYPYSDGHQTTAEVRPQEETETELLKPAEAEALYIAQHIKKHVESEDLSIPVKDTGKTRPLGYDDFALLLRSTSNQMLYEKAFKTLGVPYTVQAARALFLEAPVNDIYQLLQLVVYPGDRHAYAALLRSPFANLPDTAVFSLLSNREVPVFSEEAGWEIADPVVRQRYLLTSSLYTDLVRMTDSIPLTEIIQFIWYKGGYRWFLLKNSVNHAYLEYYDYLREIAKKADERGDSAAVFLDSLREKLGVNQKTDEIDLFQQETAGVQIMTIHKSKGLEFPAVILADAGNSGRNSIEPLVFGGTEETGPSVPYIDRTHGGKYETASNFFYIQGKELAEAMSAAELKRVLYVAMTRAQHFLLVTGCWTKMNRGEKSSNKNFLSLLAEALGAAPGETDFTSSDGEIRIRSIPAYEESDTYRMSSRVSAGSKDNGSIVMRTRIEYNETPAVTYASRQREVTATGLNRVKVGKGIKRLLSSIPSDSFFNRDTERKHNIERKRSIAAGFGTFCHAVIENRLKKRDELPLIPKQLQGLTEQQLEMVVRDGIDLADRFFASRAYKTITGNQKTVVEAEVPFLLRKEEQGNPVYIRGVIDLLVQTPDETFVLDMKTDRYCDPDEYRVQLKTYMEAAAAFTRKPVKGAIVYLREPEEIIWMK
ncbi:MAG: UvrD-helicase domain-containing protein [Bacteroidetes bacterium]|nr:UvrD-helicase domain-containing protein [Bacteroidota bacterium]